MSARVPELGHPRPGNVILGRILEQEAEWQARTRVPESSQNIDETAYRIVSELLRLGCDKHTLWLRNEDGKAYMAIVWHHETAGILLHAPSELHAKIVTMLAAECIAFSSSVTEGRVCLVRRLE